MNLRRRERTPFDQAEQMIGHAAAGAGDRHHRLGARQPGQAPRLGGNPLGGGERVSPEFDHQRTE